MGPIRGFRVVNLRVQDGGLDKVAYPDLTIDIGTGDHVVIGLENGGGKGTLLGFLFHVLLPDARLFLPRRAQRRQQRQGEEKRIEQYVPGGRLPTHVVIELGLPGQETRALAGACLYKPDGSGHEGRAEEFFWSARCVAPNLMLDALGLRSGTGRLLDHREWRKWLEAVNTARPDAEIVITSGHADWTEHLRSDLKVDVEFVRTWLLAMNEDEGAADHVFTYGSSRAFLDTLVRAVAPPETVDDINQSLTVMAADASRMKTDRRREALLRRLEDHTGPLAAHMDEHAARDNARRTLTDALLAGRDRMTQKRSRVTAELGQARQSEQDAAAAASAASAAEAKAAALELLAHLQEARLRHAHASARAQRQRAAVSESESLASACEAAAVLCRQRTLQARVNDIGRMLAGKSQDAEPDRKAASSAVHAWLARLDTDREVISGQRTAAQQEATGAQQAEDLHGDELVAAAGAIAEAEAGIAGTSAELDQITSAEDEARNRGDLPAGQAVTEALTAAGDQAAALDEQARQALSLRQGRQGDLDLLAEETAEFRARAASSEADLTAAHDALNEVKTVTADLAADLTDSGLLDLEDIQLADHAELISDTLAAVAASASARHLDTGAKAAAAQRAVHSLETSGLLPPRPDVTAVCERASRFGARPGWTYLAELPLGTARRFAHDLPGLADGIVVNVPDDFPHVVELARQHHAELHGPVVIGPPSAFMPGNPDAPVTVVLPGEAFWSKAAGQRELASRHGELARHQHAAAEETARYENAIGLRTRVTRWLTDVGPDAETAAEARLAAAREAASQAQATLTVLSERQQQLTSERDAAGKAEQDLRQQAASARSRADRLAALEKRAAPRGKLQERIARLRGDANRHKAARNAAEQARQQARDRRESATQAAERLSATIAGLTVARADADAAAALVTRPGDDVSQEDANRDRALLAERARTLTDRWRGLISDERLQGELAQLQRQLSTLEDTLPDEHDPGTAESARAARRLVAAGPSRAEADFQHAAAAERQRTIRLSLDAGSLEETARACARSVTDLAADPRLQGGAHLPPEYTATGLAEAEGIHEQLRAGHRTAQDQRQQASKAHDAEKEQAGALDDWISLLSQTEGRLDATLRRLALAGKLADRIDLEDRAFDLSGMPVPEDAPESLTGLLSLLCGAEPPDNTARARAERRAADIDAEAGHIQAILDDSGHQANSELESIRVILQGAGDEIVAGDRLIQVLRDLKPSDLAAQAGRYHRDTSARLAAVAHHVARFDDRLRTLAKTTTAHVNHLLREVRKTVAASQLPSTPALGRWGGLPLMKISGLDTLNHPQREAAILTTLQRWFDPDHGAARPGFDAGEAVSALMAAVAPRVTATVLIPSDPLSAEHRPIENLAVTSGGEGVTVALILASLLAARRARSLGHRHATLLLDNPFAKVNKPMFLRLARDVSRSLGVQLVPLTGIRDLGALTVFPSLIQLRVSRRETANAVVPAGIDDDRVQDLIRNGTLYASPAELGAAAAEEAGDKAAWPVMSRADVHWQEPDLGLPTGPAPNRKAGTA